MNCFYHENLGAVATCVDCGAGLWLRSKNQAALKIFAMIDIWCLANIDSVHSLFLDQLIVLMKP